MIKDIALKNRSYRRFYEDLDITKEQLLDLIDTARLVPSGGNNQPVRYIGCCNRETNAKIFSTLKWAGYLTDWDGPTEGERPSAYVIVLHETGKNPACDIGIACQTLLLAAVEQGMGGCFIANVDRAALAQIIDIPDGYSINLVLALGYPKEKVVITEIEKDGDIKYYRDENQTHYVPKYKTADIASFIE